jgi:ADP-ribosylglycohydrolase
MRVAPLGAYFADELERCAAQARDSALVTHTHPEGVAGAVAVAIAAAMAWQLRASPSAERPARFFEAVLRHTPESVVRTGIVRAASTPAATSVVQATKTLGNGSLVTAPDTVPFCLWMAAHHLAQFKMALGKTIGANGDCDTNAAIVGGIVALSVGHNGIPKDWLLAREQVHL